MTAAALVAATGWTLVQNRQLMISRYDLPVKGLPEDFEGKRILHLSDLHRKRYGDDFSNLINSCAFLEPDYIFFTGDLFSRDETNLEPKLVLMQRLMRLAPVYYIMGNHEADAPERADCLNEALAADGVHVLLNTTEPIFAGESRINIAGTALPPQCYRNENGGHRGTMQVTPELLAGLLGPADAGVPTLLLSHTPFPLKAYALWGADAVFAGHVHGGVIRLPLIGGLLSPERRFFPRYTRGVYKYGDTRMVVSAGLGKFRLNNPAQIILATLTKG